MASDETSPDEAVGDAMREWVVSHFGRAPTQDEFERMFNVWRDEAEKIYGY